MKTTANPTPKGVQRWVILSLIPLAFLCGFALADDERIEALNELDRVEARQKKLERKVDRLMEQTNQCGARHALRI